MRYEFYTRRIKPLCIPKIVIGSLLIPSLCFANDCSDVIKLSTVASTEARGKNSWERTASRFCDKYFQEIARGNFASGNLGYSGFSVGGSSSSSNRSVTASEVCDATRSSKIVDDAYESYVRTIAPGAFGAYRACLNSSSPLQVKISAFNDKQAQIKIGYSTIVQGARGDVVVKPSDNVICDQDGEGTMEGGTSKVFMCRRKNAEVKDFITVSDNKISTLNSGLTIPWGAYRNGVPVDLADEYEQAISRTGILADKVSTLEARLDGKPSILGSFLIIDGKLNVASEGVTYNEGLITFPNPKQLPFSPVLTDLGTGSYITSTHFVSSINTENSFRLWNTTLSTDGKNSPPTYVSGVIVSVPGKYR